MINPKILRLIAIGSIVEDTLGAAISDLVDDRPVDAYDRIGCLLLAGIHEMTLVDLRSVMIVLGREWKEDEWETMICSQCAHVPGSASVS